MTDTLVIEPEPEIAAEAEAAVKVKRRGRVTFWLALGWIVVVAFHAVFASVLPWVDSYSKGSVLDGRIGPSWSHWFGTDRNGRDIFSRVCFGARITFAIGTIAIIIGMTAAGILGLVSGYFRRRVDSVITTIMDIILAFPALILALLIITIGSNPSVGAVGEAVERTISLGLFHQTLHRELLVVFVLALLSIPPLTRLVRANTLVYSQREFVLAARAVGAKNSRVIFREILPNVIPVMLTFTLTALAILIVAEGALAFLGLSVPPPQPTWGGMINDGRQVLEDQWWVSIMPMGVMFLTVLSINMLGDVLGSRFNFRDNTL